jgi:hypothetical protein
MYPSTILETLQSPTSTRADLKPSAEGEASAVQPPMKAMLSTFKAGSQCGSNRGERAPAQLPMQRQEWAVQAQRNSSCGTMNPRHFKT